ncbi:DUF599 domain-containing protein [Roseovarius faecimaris]|uniref:DUF599 domain-containing protein n=1 Tax=Roseovarius faecimaris TaxID=2494550 RepID=A0A6I6IW98_9RHOB|nr:DUF599 domain-containing protein [Roseovarius faecimaris]QGX99921.1 DUF599 domain-containing protein [Roseovarius faecimaris]
MTWSEKFSFFSTLDLAALAVLLVCWVVIGWLIERGIGARLSVSMLMAQYRRDWMQQMIGREPRVFDAQILATLRQGTAFFASATMIAIGGCLALLGNTERLAGIAEDLTLGTDPAVVWEVKILVILGFLANAFFKFVWANRLFGYCGVVMGAVPNDAAHPDATIRATQAGEINIFSARSFNRGLRSVYFGLAAGAWMLGPEALLVAALLTFAMLIRREFMSRSHRTLQRHPTQT